MQSRRNLLRMTAVAAMTAGWSTARAFAQSAPPGPGVVMNTLSTYMSAARLGALPDEVTEQAKYHLLDTIAAMVSGSELPPGQAAQRYVREHGGNGATTVVGVGLTPPPV